MKNLNNFIQEKLKISKTSFMLEKLKVNSNTKLHNEHKLIDDIMEHIGTDDQELTAYIEKWIKKFGIKYVRYVASKRDLYKFKISDDLKNDFNTEVYEKYRDEMYPYSKKDKKLKNGYSILEKPHQHGSLAILRITFPGYRWMFIVQDILNILKKNFDN